MSLLCLRLTDCNSTLQMTPDGWSKADHQMVLLFEGILMMQDPQSRSALHVYTLNMLARYSHDPA